MEDTSPPTEAATPPRKRGRKPKKVDPWATPEMKEAKRAARTAFAEMHGSTLPGVDPGAKARVENATACFVVGQPSRNIGVSAVYPLTNPDEIRYWFGEFKRWWLAKFPNLSFPWHTDSFPKEWNKCMIERTKEQAQQRARAQTRIASNPWKEMEMEG